MRYKCEECNTIWDEQQLDGVTFCPQCFQEVVPISKDDDDVYNEDEDIYNDDIYEDDDNEYDEQQEEYQQDNEY